MFLGPFRVNNRRKHAKIESNLVFLAGGVLRDTRPSVQNIYLGQLRHVLPYRGVSVEF